MLLVQHLGEESPDQRSVHACDRHNVFEGLSLHPWLVDSAGMELGCKHLVLSLSYNSICRFLGWGGVVAFVSDFCSFKPSEYTSHWSIFSQRDAEYSQEENNYLIRQKTQ